MPAMSNKNPSRRLAKNQLCLLWCAFLFCLFLAAPDDAGASNNTCDRAARVAARQHDIPVDILLAITRVETGRKVGASFEPWPWTVNMEGTGHWFDTKDQALAYVFTRFNAGARSFDIGCFQINYKWHSQAFRSIEDMFDPNIGADYAARLVKQHFARLGSWSAAAGAYHSKTPEFSRRYAARFDAVRRTFSAPPDTKPTHATSSLARPLIGSDPPHLGSLVTFGGRNARPSRSFVALN